MSARVSRERVSTDSSALRGHGVRQKPAEFLAAVAAAKPMSAAMSASASRRAGQEGVALGVAVGIVVTA